MYIGLMILAIIAVIIWALIKNISTADNARNNDQTVESCDRANDEDNDMAKVFHEEIQNGSKPYKLMNIYNQFDLMLIKSLFQSEHLPYFIEFEHTSRIRPSIGSFGKCCIYILEKDYDDAIIIINGYRKNKGEKHVENDTIRKPLEVLFGTYIVPEASDIDGIEIIYRK
jgi:hypothetical protein